MLKLRFNLKDARVISRWALENKDKVIFVVIMLLSLAVAAWIYRAQEARTEALREEIAVEEERISAAKELAKLAKETAERRALYSRGKESLDDSALRRMVSLNGIKIASLVREEGEAGGLLDSDLFNLEASGGYHNLAKFVSSLESRGELLWIESLSLKNPGPLDSGNDENEDLFFAMRIKVNYMKAR